MNFQAANPLLNATLTAGHMLVALCTAQGFPGALLFANPTGAGPQSQPVPEGAFGAAGVPTNQPIYLQLQVPSKTDYYDVGLVLLFLSYGMPLASCLA